MATELCVRIEAHARRALTGLVFLFALTLAGTVRADDVLADSGDALVVPAEQLALIGRSSADPAATGTDTPAAAVPATAQAAAASTVTETADSATAAPTAAAESPATPAPFDSDRVQASQGMMLAATEPTQAGASSAVVASETGVESTSASTSGALRQSGQALQALPGKVWTAGTAVVKGAVRDLRQPPPASARSAVEPGDHTKTCSELYYETMALVQTQHGYRSRSQYWDDERNQFIATLGATVAAPLYYVWGATATQSYHRKHADVALNARIDALRQASARKNCFVR